MKRALFIFNVAVVAALAPITSAARAQSETRALQKLERRLSTLERENLRLSRELSDFKRKAPSASGAARAGANPVTPASSADAAQPTAGDKAELQKTLDAELKTLDWGRALTAVPAFVALDVAPETVARPATPRDFAAALLNGVDRKGVLQTGIAIETSPYQLFFGNGTSLDDYRTSYWTRLLYRTSISLATAKASEDDDKAQRLALGINITLFDGDDLYQDTNVDQLHHELLQKYGVKTGEELAQTIHPSMSDEEIQRRLTVATMDFDNHAKELNQEFIEGVSALKAHWGRTAWNIAWAPSWISTSGRADDLRGDGFAAWTTFAYGFENTAIQDRIQVLAHLRYRQGEHVADPDDATKNVDQDSLLAAASVRFHLERQQMNFGVEAAYLRVWDGPNGDGHTQRIGGVVEKKLSDNTWLVLSVGQDFGGGGQQDELFAIGSLRIGTEDKARFAPGVQ